LSDEGFSRTPRLKEANFEVEKKINIFFAFQLCFYALWHFSGSKSTIATQKSDKVNKATVL
jgi:hypothetical protein